MDDCLKDVIRHNPWSEMAKEVEEHLESNSQRQRRFVLPQDDRIISEFENDYTGSASELLLNLPPQPFIGNPESKIWILQFNPGYSKSIDDYDYLGVDYLSPKDRHKNEAIFSTSTLSDRLRLISRQYRFDNAGFYALDEKFHTFKYGLRKGRGLYLWYMNVLFTNAQSLFHFVPKGKRKEFADKNIFVLEFFPYHSKGFGGVNFFPFLPSFDFWRILVQYALTHEKILICHGLSSGKSLTTAAVRSLKGYDEAKKEGWIYKVSRPGNGPSRLSLHKKCVVSMAPGKCRLQEFCEDFSVNEGIRS